MKPGRELDALIAEKVMDLRRHQWQPDNDFFCKICRMHGEEDIHNLDFYPDYSTNITDAGLVLDRLRKLGHDIDPSSLQGYIPPAICLAALHVLGIKT